MHKQFGFAIRSWEATKRGEIPFVEFGISVGNSKVLEDESVEDEIHEVAEEVLSTVKSDLWHAIPDIVVEGAPVEEQYHCWFHQSSGNWANGWPQLPNHRLYEVVHGRVQEELIPFLEHNRGRGCWNEANEYQEEEKRFVSHDRLPILFLFKNN